MSTFRDVEGCQNGACRHDGRRWLEMCAKHRAEFEATHVRWQAEHARTEQPTDEDLLS